MIVARLDTQLNSAMARGIQAYERRLAHAAQALSLLNPQQVLDRGYAVVFDAAGRTVGDASTLAIDASIRVKLRAGEVMAKVTQRSDGNLA
jgi:exodeoxyribonuclease VII large subunit